MGPGDTYSAQLRIWPQVCAACGEEVEFGAAFAEGEVPLCCGVEMSELVSQLPEQQLRSPERGMSPGPMARALSRRFRCPRCSAQTGEQCVGVMVRAGKRF